jgi:hypothetical protein
MLRISDSLAFVAASRHCYVVVDDDENKRKLFLRAKNNLAPDHKALAYGFGVLAVGHDRQTGVTIHARHIVWHPEHIDITATEAGSRSHGQSLTRGARDSAKKFLADMLASGPIPKGDIEEAAKANCISERTLWRAKTELGITAKKSGLNAGWTWELPQTQWHIGKDDDEIRPPRGR